MTQQSEQTVITRFAPSPTGFLHIGGARTALFSYYFAKRHGGQFRLRVEDTDKKRSTPEATQAILDGMDWLGLAHDGDIVYQSQNEARHKEIALALVASGHAYACFLSKEEQEQEREQSRAEGRAFRSKYRDKATNISDIPSDHSYVVRFKVPEGETILDDAVQGHVKWNNKDFDDLILLRADQSPVYMLAVIVDDHDMGVTHVIRGDDHLVNGGRQKLIYQALGWNVPVFAHIPLIFGPDGKKLSKRHGALGVDAYADMGYIPAGMRNYLTRLGWSHGDLEIFDDEQATQVFDLGAINKAPSRLDFDKMAFINGQHLQKCSIEDAFAFGQSFFVAKNEGEINLKQALRIKNALPSALTRSKTLEELANNVHFAMRDRPLEITGKAKKPLKTDAKPRLNDLHLAFSALEEANWNSKDILELLQAYIEKHDIGFGKIGPPLRACLSGGSPSPDLAVVVEVLGKDETLGRIQDCLETYFD